CLTEGTGMPGLSTRSRMAAWIASTTWSTRDRPDFLSRKGSKKRISSPKSIQLFLFYQYGYLFLIKLYMYLVNGPDENISSRHLMLLKQPLHSSLWQRFATGPMQGLTNTCGVIHHDQPSQYPRPVQSVDAFHRQPPVQRNPSLAGQSQRHVLHHARRTTGA